MKFSALFCLTALFASHAALAADVKLKFGSWTLNQDESITRTVTFSIGGKESVECLETKQSEKSDIEACPYILFVEDGAWGIDTEAVSADLVKQEARSRKD